MYPSGSCHFHFRVLSVILAVKGVVKGACGRLEVLCNPTCYFMLQLDVDLDYEGR